MSATPGFASVPRYGLQQHSSGATTDQTGATTTNIKDLLTGVAAGTKIDEITVMADGNPADCLVLIFLHDGTGYRLFDTFDIGDPAASSNTVSGYRETRRYANLFLVSTSWKLACAITVATTSGNVNVFAAGGDLT